MIDAFVDIRFALALEASDDGIFLIKRDLLYKASKLFLSEMLLYLAKG